MPDDAIAIYDLSTPILDKAATYNDGQPQGLWTVVTQCGTGVGVIPSSDYQGAVEDDALLGRFDSMLVECDG